jgi:hypothetical protein
VEKTIISVSKMAIQVWPNVRSILIMFLNIHRTMHHALLPCRQTVNTKFLFRCSIVSTGRYALKSPKWCAGDWLLHHENTLVPSGLSVHQLELNWNETCAISSILPWQWKVWDLMISQFNNNHRLHMPSSKYRTSESSSISVTITGLDASIPKGTTSERTAWNRQQIQL